MNRTTQKPPIDLLEFVPHMGDRAQTTVRLHPRRKKVAELAASKIGGQFLWPANEPWPSCDASGHLEYESPDQEDVYLGTHGKLVPVLQLRRDDFPEFEFYPGTDLFQLLWCPVNHDAPFYAAKPFVFWRDSQKVRDPLRQIPKPSRAEKGYIPQPCQLCPERVTEYPKDYLELPKKVLGKLSKTLESWTTEDFQSLFAQTNTSDGHSFYQSVLSACPSSKLGGYVYWIQGPEERPVCSCGRPMQHLLTLTDCEVDGGTFFRWLPKEDYRLWGGDQEKLDRVNCAIGLDAFVGSHMYLFICRKCKHWPIGTVFQR